MDTAFSTLFRCTDTPFRSNTRGNNVRNYYLCCFDSPAPPETRSITDYRFTPEDFASAKLTENGSLVFRNGYSVPKHLLYYRSYRQVQICHTGKTVYDKDLSLDFDFDEHADILAKLQNAVRKSIPKNEIPYCEQTWADGDLNILCSSIQWNVKKLREIQDFLDFINDIVTPIKDELDAYALG